MGCFFGCFRIKDKERQRGNVSATLQPVKSREHLIANNQSKSGRFHVSSEDFVGSSPFLTALSESKERKKTENLCRRNNSIKWTAQLIAPAEVPAVQEPKDSLNGPSHEFVPPATPPRNLAKARNLCEEEENREFNDEVKYLKSCGTLLRTPSEIREASERQRMPSGYDKNVNSEWHSWFPNPPVRKIQWDGPPGESPTPPAHLHEELCKIPTPNSILHVPSKQLSTRFEDKMHQNEDKKYTKQDSGHFGCREDKTTHGNTKSSSSTGSYFVSENEDHLQPISPMSSKLLEPIVHKPSRYGEYLAVEEDSDSFSDAGSIASRDSAAKNENISFNPFDSEASLEPQTPPLFKSTYSPQSTPLRLTDNMNTPWTGCSKILENAGVNKNARFRSQYVYPVLNPVENLSQWKELKKGILKDCEPKSNSWSERSAMTENQPLFLQTPGSKAAATDNGTPKLPCSYSISRADSISKENFLSEEEVKLMPNGLDVIDEPSQKRKHVPTTPDPVSKTPKSTGQFHHISEETPQSHVLHVDSSLSHWLKTPQIEDGNVGRSKKMPVETPNSETKTPCISSTSSSIPRVLQMQSSPSSKNIDDRPILGALSIQQLQSTSPARSPSSKSSGDDRPILGMVAAHWNDKQSTSPKWWDGKGIPNSTNKYKEDQKVSWHTTPFEERLEKALSNEGGFQRKTLYGKPINFEECEESDTAAS